MAKYLDGEGLGKLIELIKTNFPQYNAEKVIASGGIKDSSTENPSGTTVWAADGTKMDLSDYADLIAKQFPFGISSFSTGYNSTIEVSETPITPKLSWGYQNPTKHSIDSQSISDGTTVKQITKTDRTATWDPIDISTRKTITFTLTAKADNNQNSGEKKAYIITVHKRYCGALNSTDAPTSTTGLTAISEIKNSAYDEIKVTSNNQHPCYLYPKYLDPSTMKIYDQNNFDNTKDFLKKETTINGIAYVCYILEKANTLESAFTYKFKSE